MHTHTCMHTHTHTHPHTNTHTNTHTHPRTQTHTHPHLHAHTPLELDRQALNPPSLPRQRVKGFAHTPAYCTIAQTHSYIQTMFEATSSKPQSEGVRTHAFSCRWCLKHTSSSLLFFTSSHSTDHTYIILTSYSHHTYIILTAYLHHTYIILLAASRGVHWLAGWLAHGAVHCVHDQHFLDSLYACLLLILMPKYPSTHSLTHVTLITFTHSQSKGVCTACFLY